MSVNEEDMPEYEYGDLHKMVLQGIMSAGFLDSKGVKKLFVGACKALNLDPKIYASMASAQKVVKEINEKIKPFDMMIRSASCELTGIKYYIFLVTVENPIMKMQTLFSKAELQLFQKIMTAVLRKYDTFTVPETVCLNMVREIDTTRNYSAEMAQTFIQKMTRMQYLAKYYLDPEANHYEVTIGIRAIREFEPILRECYADVITNCHLCKMILLHGRQCPKCGTCVHKACLENHLKRFKNCPDCNAGWTLDNLLRRSNKKGGTDRGSQHEAASSSSQRGGRRNAEDSAVQMPVLQPMVSPSKSGQRKGVARGRSPQSKSPSASPKKKGAVNARGKGKAKGRGARGGRRTRAVISSDEEETEQEEENDD